MPIDYHSMFKQNFHSCKDVEAEKGRCVKTKEFGSANGFFSNIYFSSQGKDHFEVFDIYR